MILSIIDKVILLLKEKEKNREKIFSGFVEPLFKSFEQAHVDYMQTFVKYREFIKGKDDITLEELFLLKERVYEDSEAAYHLRSACLLESASLVESTRYDFIPFVESINCYFDDTLENCNFLSAQDHPIALAINESRATLVGYISHLQAGLHHSGYKQYLSTHMATLINQIQKKRNLVHKEYLEIKKELLTS